MGRRVHPTIRRKNLYRPYLARARRFARSWTTRYPVIEAIMLTGGVARGYADENSELDLTIFLTPSGYLRWVRHCQAPIPEGDNLLDGFWVDTHLASIDKERRRPWEPLKAWDASFARVLLDRRGRLASLLRDKVGPPMSPWDLHHKAIEAEWFVELGVGWIDRTDILAAHHLLSLALDRFLRLLFGSQGEIPPYEKWQLHLSRSLPRLPPNYERRVREWMSIRSFAAADVRRRARAADGVLRWWKDEFRNTWLRSRTRDALAALRKGPISLQAFEKRFGTQDLRAFPLRAAATVYRRNGTWLVRLDPVELHRTLDHGASGMFPYQLDRLRLAITPLKGRA